MISFLKGKGKAGTDEYGIKINPFGFSLGQVVIDMVYQTTKIYIKGRMFGGRKEEREMDPGGAQEETIEVETRLWGSG